MEKLSDEILVRIFSFLSARDLCRCSQVRNVVHAWYSHAFLPGGRAVYNLNVKEPANVFWLVFLLRISLGVFCMVSSGKRLSFVSFFVVVQYGWGKKFNMWSKKMQHTHAGSSTQKTSFVSGQPLMCLYFSWCVYSRTPWTLNWKGSLSYSKNPRLRTYILWS